MLIYRGPLISQAAKRRVIDLITSAEEEGGRILLDGRNVVVPDYPDGNFVGPTVIEAVTTMRCYKFAFLDFSGILLNLISSQGGDIWSSPDRHLRQYSG